ncbi:MAG TPA: phenylalanine--tRNA ligase subunit beta [Vicinamibacterales bacterium]|nr:phenylalanine--tRNA ligase subunit beta [Vicinamibacterales bacterium]
MKLLLSWARDFVDITAPARVIADTMALRGFEVASVDPLGADDAVIDFEVTANRPDCLSVAGLAREIATAFELPMLDVSSLPGALADLAVGPSPDVAVTIDEPAWCPRYAAAVADLTPTSSPVWMTARLQAAGVRPISPFVDITNYVLLELGHPMHAFDLDTLADRHIRIRRAGAGEVITTLDDVERPLDGEMLVIADAVRPQAVAGVMGGRASEVSPRTRRVVFESACFNPASVRRTSKRLGLKTEASSRFERGTDVNGPFTALRRAVALMQQIGAGTLHGVAVDAYPQPRGPIAIDLRRERLARVLGLSIPDADVERILRSLNLAATATDGGWTVTVPTIRVDLLREIDLVEEVGRHFGFDKLEAAFPVMTSAAAPADPRVSRDRLVRRVCASAGLTEAVTFGFIERRTAESFLDDGGAAAIVAVANPLSAKFDVLRPSLLPGLVESVAHNRRHGRRDVALYEIGSRFSSAAGESRGLALAWTGAVSEHWSGGGRGVDVFDAKGVVELVCSALGVSPTFSTTRLPFLVPGQAAIVAAGGEPIGILGQLAPVLADRAGAPRQDAVMVAELDLDRIERRRTREVERVRPLPRHPFVVRDVSLVVADTLPAEIIRGTIQASGDGQPAPLVAITFFDRYQGQGVPAGSISLSIRLTFQAPDRTLTDSEVQTTFDTILAALMREHAAVQR